MKQLITFCLLIISISSFSQTNVKNAIPNFEEVGKKDRLDIWTEVNSVNIYGSGALFSIVTAEEELKDASTPFGSLGVNFITKRMSCDIFFSYNSRSIVEMNSLSKFGHSLMNPNIGGHSFAFSLKGSLAERAGFSGNVLLADNLWKIDSTTTIDASPMIARIGGYFKPFKFDLTDNDIDFVLMAHYTHRGIVGDFNNETRIIDGTEIIPRGYNGVEISASLFFNSVEIFGQATINELGDNNLEGFSGTQIMFGINVSGDFIKLK